MDDLIVFLNARLDEQENHARRLLCTAQDTLLTLADPKLLGKHIPGWYAWRDVETLCTTTLREVAAKRALLALHGPNGNPDDEWYGSNVRCTECGGYNLVAGYGAMGFSSPWPCKTLRILVAVYSDHPDYQEKWAA